MRTRINDDTSRLIDTYYLYRGILRRMSLFTGVWPGSGPKAISRVFPIIHTAAASIIISAILNFCHQHITKLHLVLKCISLILSFFTLIEKMMCFTFYRKRLAELHSRLDYTFHQDLQDLELRPILLSPVRTAFRSSLTLLIAGCIIVAIYWVTPILVIIIQLSSGAKVVNYNLPFPTSYPWKIEANSWLFWCHYAFEVYAGICLNTIASSIDWLFGFYIYQISAQFRTLSYRISNLDWKKNYQQVISECVTRHQILTLCQDHLEQIYGPIALWLTVSNALVICGLIYQAINLTWGKAMIIGVFVFFKTMQTLFYGWFGSVLTTENDNFREAIYASDWAGSGEKTLMTNILIMIIYNRPFVLKACSIATISVDMFVAVSNTAISYFFMLRTLEEAHAQ
uniref:Odorant receptor n=1 Tax=Campoletis chlorideae TaxID=219166 RepID=A0A346D3Y7_9HYME|nr:odorant receptor [Campoletis chlorideae]